jgi:hypothetical protein
MAWRIILRKPGWCITVTDHREPPMTPCHAFLFQRAA